MIGGFQRMKVMLISMFLIVTIFTFHIHQLFANNTALDAFERDKIFSLCQKFHSALKQKNITLLSKLALPGNEASVKRFLSDESSDLYKYLISNELEKNECWRSFLDIKNVRYKIMGFYAGPGVKVNIYNGDKFNEETVDFDNICDAMSVFLLKENNEWHISFQYFFNEDY
jgi:hypothetical protein